MRYHNGQKFSTPDKDNDVTTNHCAAVFKSGWWYKSCKHANLNCVYKIANATAEVDGVLWRQWTEDYYSLKTTEMKNRRAKTYVMSCVRK